MRIRRWLEVGTWDHVVLQLSGWFPYGEICISPHYSEVKLCGETKVKVGVLEVKKCSRTSNKVSEEFCDNLRSFVQKKKKKARGPAGINQNNLSAHLVHQTGSKEHQTSHNN